MPVATWLEPAATGYMLKNKECEFESGEMTAYTIDFEPLGRRGRCQDGKSLLDCARQCGAGISSVCGGQGTCGSCRVRIADGNVSEPTSRERETFTPQELQSGWRLACQTYPRSHCRVIVPAESMTTPQRVQVEGILVPVTPELPVQDCPVRLTPPSLSELTADAGRLLGALNQHCDGLCRQVDIEVLRALPGQLRSWDWECRASVRSGELVAIIPRFSRHLGLAIDLGTTKIAGYLVDLGGGDTLAAQGVMNPQISYGEDIISRINASINSTDTGLKLHRLVIDAINQLAGDLCSSVNASTREIVEAVVVGNTVMHHLFLGLPVSQLARAPYVPAVSQSLDIKARDVGLEIAGGAYVHLLPNIAGFVGADHVAMLLATKNWQRATPVIAIDIGTNTEVSCIKNGEITAVSCASGPAFEGGHITDGMRAASGAIERLRVTDAGIQYQTIDDAPPAGMCGSGILDALAQLYMAGIIDAGGRMNDNHPRVHRRHKQREFWLVSREERGGLPPIVITQSDIRALQLAKAAIRTGIEVLLKTSGITEQQIKQVIIAGAFGSYIDVTSAITIGMLPPFPPGCFRQVGNAAGAGARRALLSLNERTEARQIASRVHYLELASVPDFMPTFLAAGYLGRYRIRNGKREGST